MSILDQKTINIMALIATITVAIVGAIGVVFYLIELYLGQATVPASVAQSLASFIILVLAAAGPWLSGELRRRQADASTKATQAQIAQVATIAQRTDDRVHDGLAEETATRTTNKVIEATQNTSAAGIAALQSSQQAITGNQQAILATAQAVQALLAHAAASNPKLQEAVQANTSATVENTNATEKANP